MPARPRSSCPKEYLLSVGTLEPRKGITALIQSLARPESVDLPLLIVGPAGWGDLDVAAIAAEAGLAEGRVRTLGFLADADLAVVAGPRHRVRVPEPGRGVRAAGDRGVPVRHAGGALGCPGRARGGRGRGRDRGPGGPRRATRSGWPTAIASVVGDPALLRRLHTTGLDRAKAFSWKDSAEKVWQLHADL